MKNLVILFLLICSSLISREPQINVQVVSGGATNQNFRVQIDDRVMFLRIGKSANVEYKNASKAYSIGLTPKIFYHNPSLNILITSYIHHDKRKGDFSIIEKIRELHQSNIQFDQVFCPFEEIRENRQYCSSDFYEKVLELERKLVKLRQDCPCHLDLHMGNFLFDNEQIWVIDWETAGMSDPIFDLATFASTEGLSDEEMKQILSQYFQRAVTDDEIAYFSDLRFLADVRWAIWSRKQAESSQLDWNYEGDYLRYSEQALKYLNLNLN